MSLRFSRTSLEALKWRTTAPVLCISKGITSTLNEIRFLKLLWMTKQKQCLRFWNTQLNKRVLIREKTFNFLIFYLFSCPKRGGGGATSMIISNFNFLYVNMRKLFAESKKWLGEGLLTLRAWFSVNLNILFHFAQPNIKYSLFKVISS